MRPLTLFTALLLLPAAAMAKAPTCDALEGDKKQLADQILASSYAYDCCDDTLAACLQAKPPCKLVVRLAEAVCGRVEHGPPAIRARALRQHATRAGASVLPELRRCLAEGRPKKLAREAYRQMEALGTEAEPTALEMLKSPLWTERKAAVSLLRRWGKLTPQQQADAREDPHVAVRHAADFSPGQIAAAEAGHPKWAGRIAPPRAGAG